MSWFRIRFWRRCRTDSRHVAAERPTKSGTHSSLDIGRRKRPAREMKVRKVVVAALRGKVKEFSTLLGNPAEGAGFPLSRSSRRRRSLRPRYRQQIGCRIMTRACGIWGRSEALGMDSADDADRVVVSSGLPNVIVLEATADLVNKCQGTQAVCPTCLSLFSMWPRAPRKSCFQILPSFSTVRSVSPKLLHE